MQSQQSLSDQLSELAKLAIAHGLYDAHDWLLNQRPLKRIVDVECTCSGCGWIGTVGNCEPDVDGDGSLGCPECLTVVTVNLG